MIKRFCLILSLSTVMLAFQNCGSTAGLSSHTFIDTGPSSKADEQVVLPSTANFNKVVSDPNLEGAISQAARLEIDMDRGDLKYQSKTCALDLIRLSKLKDLLRDSKVCQPGALPSGQVQCLALGIADIQLLDQSSSSNGSSNSNSSSQSEIKLRPLVCGFGTFLCDGKDASLRALITDIRMNPPADCQ